MVPKIVWTYPLGGFADWIVNLSAFDSLSTVNHTERYSVIMPDFQVTVFTLAIKYKYTKCLL
ncbi:hypothetical protein QUF50_06435 [Thiotrichales bacterium HSG1]|nr:hypothetical protein [Thiotrichales bacterium HSG1]